MPRPGGFSNGGDLKGGQLSSRCLEMNFDSSPTAQEAAHQRLGANMKDRMSKICDGRRGRNRVCDQRLKRPLLCQLSYTPARAGEKGFLRRPSWPGHSGTGDPMDRPPLCNPFLPRQRGARGWDALLRQRVLASRLGVSRAEFADCERRDRSAAPAVQTEVLAVSLPLSSAGGPDRGPCGFSSAQQRW